jgi:RNA polymerase sigma-70 factor, ECF subfamily
MRSLRSLRRLQPPCDPDSPEKGDDAEDAQLVERALAGDRGAEEAIYKRHVGYVAGMVLRLLVDQAETEDIVQDTFALALQELPRLRQRSSLRAWLAQIAVSQVHRRFRRRRLLRLLGLDRSEDPAAALERIAAPDASPDVRSELAFLGRLLHELPIAQCIAWSLRYVEGATLEEVASACACSLATAKRRIAAADKQVRAMVRVADGGRPLPFARPRRSEVRP